MVHKLDSVYILQSKCTVVSMFHGDPMNPATGLACGAFSSILQHAGKPTSYCLSMQVSVTCSRSLSKRGDNSSVHFVGVAQNLSQSSNCCRFM